LPVSAGTLQLTIRARSPDVLMEEFILSNDPLWRPNLPATAPDLLVWRTSDAAARLAWSDAPENADKIAVEYSLDAVNFEVFTSVSAKETSLNVGGLGPATYFFRVYFYNDVNRTDSSIIGVASYNGN
jgi:hypothetical protein